MKGPKGLVTGTLPIMPETASSLRRLLGRDSTRNEHLQEVLLGDPAATIAVFRRLGEARPGAGEQVTDAAHAVSLIGIEPFRRLLDELPETAPAKPPGGAPPGPSSAYSQAAHAAFYAGALAESRGMSGNREAATAALLQNPAVLALWATDPQSAQRAANAVQDGVSASIAFGAELGEPLDAANCRLANAWSFPRLAQQALGSGGDTNPRARLVRLADGLAQSTSVGWQNEETAPLTELLADFLDLTPDQACAWLHRQAIDAARTLSRFEYPLPGFDLIATPGGTAEPDDADDDVPLMGSYRPYATPPATAATDLHTMMAGIMRRVRQEAGVARVMFAMLNKERTRLRTRLALGGEADDGLRRLDLDLGQVNLFTLLLGKPQSVWLNPDNAGRYRQYLPDTLRELLAGDTAYMMSMFVGDRPLGLLYGDGSVLDERGYRRFRELCQEATSALGAGGRAEVPGHSGR